MTSIDLFNYIVILIIKSIVKCGFHRALYYSCTQPPMVTVHGDGLCTATFPTLLDLCSAQTV